MATVFHRDFAQPEPLPAEAKAAVNELLDSGRLFRYQGTSAVSDAEVEFARYVGSKYALGVNSGGCALFLGLKVAFETLLKTDGEGKTTIPAFSAAGAEAPGVLTNCFTLSPVPGAIAHAGGRPVLVDCDRSTCQISVKDLYRKQKESGAKVLLLSYMRGRVPTDFHAILEFCEQQKVILIEDCAHTLGTMITTRRKGAARMCGTFGHIGAFSLQTNKLLNAGEGGILVTDCAKVLAKATVLSGSYGHFGLHASRPEELDEYEKVYQYTPNCSMRMTSITGVLITTQLASLAARVERMNAHWSILYKRLTSLEGELEGTLYVAPRAEIEEVFVGSSFQFNLHCQQFRRSKRRCDLFSRLLTERKVAHAWYGRESWVGFVSTYKHWSYVTESGDGRQAQESPHTDGRSDVSDALLDTLIDIPLYHSSLWEDSDFVLLADIIMEALRLALAAEDLEGPETGLETPTPERSTSCSSGPEKSVEDAH
eukprot:TRINITY_DN33957_c0_g1_i1.p1 TRINITY_DN33957_c0_g1~~TRINITY_DN33957_c0_g1_i1.p1  ORF type:complete len:513 (-),score=47.66 TRINITY_DN33957_c0_g1_i1:330-1778(-)